MAGIEARISALERQGILNLFEGQELAALRDERQTQEENLRKEREGKQIFTLEYKKGFFTNPEENWDTRKVEIWEETPVLAAQRAVRRMMFEERGYTLTGEARLDVSICDQAQPHDPEWVNPYLLAKDGYEMTTEYDGLVNVTNVAFTPINPALQNS